MSSTPSSPIDDDVSNVALIGTVLSNTALFLLLFGMAGTIDVKSLRRQSKKLSALLTGLGTQFFIMPLMGFTSIVLFTGKDLPTLKV